MKVLLGQQLLVQNLQAENFSLGSFDFLELILEMLFRNGT